VNFKIIETTATRITNAAGEEFALGYKVFLAERGYSRTLLNTVWTIIKFENDLAQVQANNRRPQWFPIQHLRLFKKVNEPLFFFKKGRAGL
jgi:hypothetical protein